MKVNYNITSLKFAATCVGIPMWQWNKYMEGAVKANGSNIRHLIKMHLPELYVDLGLQFYNPYEPQSKRTKTHFIYIHSGIEYFLKFKL